MQDARINPSPTRLTTRDSTRLKSNSSAMAGSITICAAAISSVIRLDCSGL
jgi:hypothetical protein